MMLLGISGGIQAQESKDVLVEEAKYEFKHHWFLQGGAGVGYTIGETQQSWDLFSPAAALNVGYQFTPLWAVRLAPVVGKVVVVSPQRYSTTMTSITYRQTLM